MLEPLSPNHIPPKTPETRQDEDLNPAKSTGDSAGYSFNFFSKSKKRQQSNKGDESTSSSVYNDSEAVKLSLSSEALGKIKKQRYLRQKKHQDQQ